MPQVPPVIGYINLHVHDYAQAVAFYRDVVGLPLLFADESFSFARFAAGGVTFAVAGDPNLARQTPAQDRMSGIGFQVPDVDAAHEALKANGVRFTMPPTKQPWGGYMAMFADPEGNVHYLDSMP